MNINNDNSKINLYHLTVVDENIQYVAWCLIRPFLPTLKTTNFSIILYIQYHRIWRVLYHIMYDGVN